MITVVVHYGNHNKYSLELPNDTKLGFLASCLTTLIKQEPDNVLYMLMGGKIVGAGELSFNKQLSECDIVNGHCVVSLVFRDPTIKYPDSDLYISTRNLRWLQSNSNSISNSNGNSNRLQGNMSALLQTLGVDLASTLVDVPVTIPTSEYEQYIMQMDTNPEDPCSICSQIITEEAVALSCGHEFHDHCIREWLTMNSVQCPNCNHDVRRS